MTTSEIGPLSGPTPFSDNKYETSSPGCAPSGRRTRGETRDEEGRRTEEGQTKGGRAVGVMRASPAPPSIDSIVALTDEILAAPGGGVAVADGGEEGESLREGRGGDETVTAGRRSVGESGAPRVRPLDDDADEGGSGAGARTSWVVGAEDR